MDTRHEHDTHSQTTSPLRAPFSRGPRLPLRGGAGGSPLPRAHPPVRSPIWLSDGRGTRPPLLAFFGCGPAAVSSSLPDSVDPADGDPVPDSPAGEDGGIGSCRFPSQGGRAGSPWSTNRARGMAIFFLWSCVTGLLLWWGRERFLKTNKKSRLLLGGVGFWKRKASAAPCLSRASPESRPRCTWSTWSAVISRTPRTGELRSAPSWPGR